jgi:PRTRC genetic system protein C
MSSRLTFRVTFSETNVINSEILQGGGGGLNITMTIETMAREFRYDGLRLPDPNAKLSVDEVRTAFSATYPEIATAAVTGPEAVGNKLVYHFTKAIGTKG